MKSKDIVKNCEKMDKNGIYIHGGYRHVEYFNPNELAEMFIDSLKEELNKNEVKQLLIKKVRNGVYEPLIPDSIEEKRLKFYVEIRFE